MFGIRNSVIARIGLVTAALTTTAVTSVAVPATAAPAKDEVCDSGFVCLYGEFALFPYAEYSQPGSYNLQGTGSTRINNQLVIHRLFGCTGVNGSGVCFGPLPTITDSGPQGIKSIRII